MALAFGLVMASDSPGRSEASRCQLMRAALRSGRSTWAVELGQLVFVAAVLPVVVAASKQRWYRRGVLGGGSLVISWRTVVWILERALNLSLVAPR